MTASEDAPSSRPRRVLLVEDEERVASLLIQSLERSGFEVLYARSGEEALTFARDGASPPDLLVADFCLPGISGVEVVRKLSTRWRGLRVLLTSGCGFEATHEADRLGRSYEFMPKPFTPRAFVQRVLAMLA